MPSSAAFGAPTAAAAAVKHYTWFCSKREEDDASRSRSSSFPRTTAVRHLTGSLTATEGLRFAIVVARFNEIVTRPLLEGALDTFKKYSVKEEDIEVVWVPGSFEISLVAERLGKSRKYQAILCIGAVSGRVLESKIVMGLVGSGAHPTIVTSLVRAAALVGLESVDDNWLVFPTSCQIRGDTTHYDAVANSAASGVLSAGLNS
ncbi:hypothetical protein C3L33_17594, partial [Rhododendron williamsianum]